MRVTRSALFWKTLHLFAQKQFGLTHCAADCVITNQYESLCFRIAQKNSKLFIVRQKEPDSVRARWSFVCQQNCKCVARTSLTFARGT